jgi:hypothetical protein
MEKTFSVSEAISFGWNTFKSNWKFWIVAFLLFTAGSSSGFNYERTYEINSDRNNNGNVQSDVVYEDGTLGEISPSIMPGRLSSLRNFESNVLGVSTEAGGEGSFWSKYLWIILLPLLLLFLLVFIPLIIISSLVSVIFGMGFIDLTLDSVRGKQVYYKTLLNQVSFSKALRFLGAQILVALIVILGLVLFIVPGIIFGVKYSLVPFLIVDQDAKIGEALKRSAQLTKGIRFKLFLFSLATLLVTVLGLLALGVGVIVSFIVVSLAGAYIYNTLLEQSDISENGERTPEPVSSSEDTPVPSEGVLAS